VATWDDVRSVALALPGAVEVSSRGLPQWKVRDRLFVWERPLRRKDVAELGDAAPTGPVLGARVPDEGAKQALVADEPEVFFTTSHFDGYPAVLARLDLLGREALEELVVEAWADRAPARLVRQHLGDRERLR
jgi:hypothetical protein